MILASCLSGVHFLIAPISSLSAKKQAIISSAGGGFAISYVFLHLMPELAYGGSLLSKNQYILHYTPAPLIESLLFFVSLSGVILFFTLDVISETTKKAQRSLFVIHISAFSLLNYLYAYTLPSLVSTGWNYSFLFTVAIAAHVLTVERVLAKSHKNFYRKKFRWIGVVSILIGIMHAYFLHPISDITLAVATGFLGGGVLLTAFREELPKASVTSLPWFMIGTLFMSSSLIAILIIGH